MSDSKYLIRPKRKVLIVDDEEINREILGNILSESYTVVYAENGQQAYEKLKESSIRYSLILLDLKMPVMDGFELLEKIKADEKLTNIPVIVMTSEKPAEVRSIKMGADDFITKPYDMPEVILARCERIIQLYEDKSIIRAAEKDELTGLYTKGFFKEYVAQADRDFEDVAMDMVVLNIEHFHMLNETFGHKTGDDVLRKIADILTSLFGDGISVGCRPGMDYYFFYVEHHDSYESCFEVIQEELEKYSQIPKIRIRIGIYPNVDKNTPIDGRFDHAKQACDRLRGDYKKHINFYSKELNEKELYHERLIVDIDNAIKNKDLIVYYQPKYGIQGEAPELRSAEALIRWKHPELGMISPGDFIPLFESNGLIQEVDRYVWEEAAVQIKEWKEKYGVTIPVSVNVSRVDINNPELKDTFLRLVEENGLSTDDLMLEITESAYSDNAEGLIQIVESMRERGFKIEMDDFGTGYSSLNMLTSIPIDVLKLDREFIINMNKSDKSRMLVELVIEIANFLDVPIVAEGVENEAQYETLRSMGCDIIQGYYFSRPVAPEEFEVFIQRKINID